MAYNLQVTIDCAEPHALARWWAAALGWEKESQNEAFIRQMIEQGLATEGDTIMFEGSLVWKSGAGVVRPDGLSPRLLFQLVPEPKTTKNRVHLDVRVGAEDVEAVVARLVDSGATFLHRGQQGPVHTWVTLADPEGNELCVSLSPPG